MLANRAFRKLYRRDERGYFFAALQIDAGSQHCFLMSLLARSLETEINTSRLMPFHAIATIGLTQKFFEFIAEYRCSVD